MSICVGLKISRKECGGVSVSIRIPVVPLLFILELFYKRKGRLSYEYCSKEYCYLYGFVCFAQFRSYYPLQKHQFLKAEVLCIINTYMHAVILYLIRLAYEFSQPTGKFSLFLLHMYIVYATVMRPQHWLQSQANWLVSDH